MSTLMNITIIGNLGKDAEVRTTQDGTSVINFSIGHSSGTKEKPKTTWVNCSYWVKSGGSTSVAQYLTKGKKICCVGDDIHARPWVSKDNTAEASLEFRVGRIILLDSASSGNDAGGERNRQSLNPSQTLKTRTATSQTSAPAVDDTDDLPF